MSYLFVYPFTLNVNIYHRNLKTVEEKIVHNRNSLKKKDAVGSRGAQCTKQIFCLEVNVNTPHPEDYGCVQKGIYIYYECYSYDGIDDTELRYGKVSNVLLAFKFNDMFLSRAVSMLQAAVCLNLYY